AWAGRGAVQLPDEAAEILAAARRDHPPAAAQPVRRGAAGDVRGADRLPAARPAAGAGAGPLAPVPAGPRRPRHRLRPRRLGRPGRGGRPGLQEVEGPNPRRQAAAEAEEGRQVRAAAVKSYAHYRTRASGGLAWGKRRRRGARAAIAVAITARAPFSGMVLVA